MKGELSIAVKRGAESRQLLTLWAPIVCNILITIAVTIIALLPCWWWIKILAILAFTIAVFYSCFLSNWGMTRIFNLAFKVKVYFENHEF